MYRIASYPNFPLVALCLLFSSLGVFCWVLYGFKGLSSYPAFFHKNTMSLGFSGSFMLFLWFQGITLKKHHLLLLSFFYASLCFSYSLFNTPSAGPLLGAFFTFCYLLRQKQAPKTPLPLNLIFIQSLIVLIYASLAPYLAQDFAPFWLVLAGKLSFQGVFLAAFFGCVFAICRILYPDSKKALSFWPAFGLFLTLFGLCLEAASPIVAFKGVKLAGLCLAGVYHPPKKGNRLAFWLWLACLFVPLSFLLSLLYPSYEIHLLHIFYVMGISLIGLLVLSSLRCPPLSKKMLLVISLLLIVAGLTRSTAIFLKGSYERHLAYAAILLIAASFYLLFYKSDSRPLSQKD